jgi:hypothetical protein
LQPLRNVPDGNGLYLRITPSGTKGWMFRFKRLSKSRDMGLGVYPAVGLATARDLAEAARALLRQGLDPIEERKAKVEVPQQPAPAIVAFDEAARRYIAAHKAAWRNPKHRAQWSSTLSTYAGPLIGGKAVADIGTDDVVDILAPIWTAKPETSSRLRGRIEKILDWAKFKKLREGPNPAVWRTHLEHELPSPKKLKTVRHHPALPWREIPEFMAELRANTCLSSLPQICGRRCGSDCATDHAASLNRAASRRRGTPERSDV